MAIIAIVYHSGHGHTTRLAEAVSRGVKQASGATARLLSVEDAIHHMDALDDADAIIFGAPTYMGSCSAAFKAFADASHHKWSQQAWRDKLAAGFTNSGSLSGDKLITLTQMIALAAQHSMLWVSLGLPPPHVTSGHGPDGDAINRLGAFLGAMSQSDDAPPDQALAPGDLRTAELLGLRVATLATRWKNSK